MITSLLKQELKRPGFKLITVETEPGMLDEIFGAVRDMRADMKYTTRFAEAWNTILGGLRYREHKLTRYNIFNTIATPGQIEYLDKLEGVKTITLDREYRTPEGYIREKYEEYRGRYRGDYGERRVRGIEPGWMPTTKHVKALGLDQAHREGRTGTGVKVVELDTGSAHVEQLRGANITRDRTTAEVRDDSGHGTEVASQIVGQHMERNGVEFIGGSPDCELRDIKVLQTPLGIGWASGIAAGVAKAEDWGAQFIHASLGSETIDEKGADVIAFQHAIDAGIIVVVASGNAGAETVGSPAHLNGLIAVGSEGFDGRIAEFSSWGTAPGGRRIPDCTSLGGSNSTDPWEYVYSSTSPLSLGDFLDHSLDAMTIMMGTSQAAPWVTCLLVNAYQAGYIATIEDVRKVLEKNPWTKEKGYGRLTWDMFG